MEISENDTIESLWNKAVSYGLEVNLENKDGLTSWNLVKSQLAKYPIMNSKCKWNTFDKEPEHYLHKIFSNMDNEYLKDVHGVNEFTMLDDVIDSNTSHPDWEKDHFLIQHFRIPYKNPNPTPIRMIQVAYNTGQLMAIMSRDTFSYMEYIHMLPKDILNASRYIPSNLLPKKLSDNIDEVRQTGGRLRYLTYKNKYIKHKYH